MRNRTLFQGFVSRVRTTRNGYSFFVRGGNRDDDPVWPCWLPASAGAKLEAALQEWESAFVVGEGRLSWKPGEHLTIWVTSMYVIKPDAFKLITRGRQRVDGEPEDAAAVQAVRRELVEEPAKTQAPAVEAPAADELDLDDDIPF